MCGNARGDHQHPGLPRAERSRIGHAQTPSRSRRPDDDQAPSPRRLQPDRARRRPLCSPARDQTRNPPGRTTRWRECPEPGDEEVRGGARERPALLRTGARPRAGAGRRTVPRQPAVCQREESLGQVASRTGRTMRSSQRCSLDLPGLMTWRGAVSTSWTWLGMVARAVWLAGVRSAGCCRMAATRTSGRDGRAALVSGSASGSAGARWPLPMQCQASQVPGGVGGR